MDIPSVSASNCDKSEAGLTKHGLETEENLKFSKKWRGDEEPSVIQEQRKDATRGDVCEKGTKEAIEPLTIHDLFDELLQKVFSYLPAKEVFGTLSEVCLRWERIARDPCTLNHTQLILDGNDNELCLQVLKEAPCIGEVYILPTCTSAALSYLIQGPKVKKLVVVSVCSDDCPFPDELIAILVHNKDSLQRLSMNICSNLVHFHKHQEVGFPSFQSLIAGMKHLSHLHLSGECWQGWDQCDLSKEHPYLQSLRIDSASFIVDECPFIRDLIMLSKPTLRILHLPCQFQQDALSLLNAGVFEGSLVEEFMVSTGCLRVISQMHNLKTLAISDIEEEEEERDLEWLKRMPMLSGIRKLTLQSLTETVKKGLVWHVLSKFNCVEEFWGIESIVKEETFTMFLNNNSKMRDMYFLDFCGFDNVNQVKLLDGLPNLRVLDFALSQISDKMCESLRNFNKRRPNLKIVYGDEYDEQNYDSFSFAP